VIVKKARVVRLTLYTVGILIAVLEIKFQLVTHTWDNLAIRRVQVLAQYENQYHNSWLGVEILQYPSDLVV
jgi:hypothetical protein